MRRVIGNGLRRTPTTFRPRRRLRWVLAVSFLVLVLVLAFAGVACYVVSDVTYPGEEVSKAILPDTDGYVSFNLEPGLSQSMKFKSFLDCFFDTASVNDRWQGVLQQIEADWGIDIEEDIQPWLGPEVAYGTVHGPTASTRGPEMFFYAGTTDEAATQAVLNKWLQKRVERDGMSLGNQTYRGVVVTCVNPDNPPDLECYAVARDYLDHAYGLGFLGNLTRLQQTIDLMLDGGPSLWDNADFQTARAKLPQERVGMGYGDAEHILSALVKPAPGDAVAQALWDAFSPYAPTYVGLAISFADEGVALDFYAPTPAAMGFAVQPPMALQTAGLVPGDAMAFAAGQNPGLWWQQFLDKLAELAQNPDMDAWLQEKLNIQAIEEDWGIDFEDDVFSWMTGEIAGAGLPYWGEGPGGGPAMLFLFETGNQTLAEAKMAEIVVATLNELVESGQAADSYTTDIGGVPATMMRWEDYPGSGLKTKTGYLFLDGFVVAGTSEHALATAVDAYQHPASSLSQSAEFQNMLTRLPAENTGLFYANGPLTADFVLNHAVTDMASREVYYEKLAPIIEPVQSAGFAYHVGAEDSTARVAFHVKNVEVPLTAVCIDAPAYVGEGYDFTATVDVCQVQDLGAAQYDVNYDPTLLQLTDVTSGRIDGTDIPAGGWTEPAPGTVSLAQIMPGSGVSGRGYLAALHFHVVGSAGDRTDITLSNGMLGDAEANEIPADWLGDSVEVFLGGAISGVVRDEAGNPISGASLYSWGFDSGTWAGSAVTAGDGTYIIGRLGSGNCRVEAWSPGYLSEYYDGVYQREEASPVSVTSPENTTGIDFVLEPPPRITGHVYRADGVTPVPNLHVYATDYDTNKWTAGANTDGNGYYALVVPPGLYRVRACGSCSGLTYVSEFYNDTYDYNAAAEVPVTASSDTPNIDFVLELAGTITGRVYQEDAVTPIPNVHVYATDYHSNAWIDGTNTSGNGSYRLVLPGGTYRLRTCAYACSGLPYVDEYYNDTYDYSDATPVPVTVANDTPDVNFILGVGGTISGHVYKEDGVTPLPNATICAEDYDSGTKMGCSSSNGQGNYSLLLPTGTYRVRVSSLWPYAGEYYDDTYNNSEATVVPVTAPNDTPNIDFVLELGGTITGRVYQQDAATPIPNVHVYATDYHSNAWMDGTNTAGNGSYRLVLPSGTYRVRACGSCCTGAPYADQYYDHTYSYDEAAEVPVTAPGETPNISFTLSLMLRRATVDEAVGAGVAWLAGGQNPDGSWGSHWVMAKTALAVLNLETYATRQGYASPFDPAFPYREQVEKGLNYIFGHAYATGISPQPAGNPDTDGDGVGVYFYIPGESGDEKEMGGYPNYDTSMVMMAIAASGAPDRVVTAPGSAVNGWTYRDVLQDAVDYMAWGQTDWGHGRGGWSYWQTDNGGPWSDQSNSGWVTLGLAYAEAAPPQGFGLTVPGFVRSELDRWINYIQDDVNGDPNDGGSHYSDLNNTGEPSVNMLKTGNLLQQMAFVGDTASTPRVQDAVDYMMRHWKDPSSDPGWRGCPACYQATYTVMKGFEALGIQNIDFYTDCAEPYVDCGNPINWFNDFTDVLLAQQGQDGWWLAGCFDDGDRILSTDWAILTLLKEVRTPPLEPDLVILDKHEEWVDAGAGTYRVFYTVKNVGDGEAPPGHDVRLTVDGVPIEQKTVPGPLGPGATYSDSFETVVTRSGAVDEITVCADVNDEVQEKNPDNNCLTNALPCTIVRVSPPSQTVNTGSFYVDVYVIPATAIAGAQFNLTFDPALMGAAGVTEGNLLDQNGASTSFNPGTIDNVSGTVGTVYGAITTPGASVARPGIFARVTFNAGGAAGTSALHLSNIEVGDPQGQLVCIVVEDGSVTVQPWPDWDVNGDGCINVLDIIVVGQHFGETSPVAHWIREDVNRDGRISVLDIILIGQHFGEGCGKVAYDNDRQLMQMAAPAFYGDMHAGFDSTSHSWQNYSVLLGHYQATYLGLATSHYLVESSTASDPANPANPRVDGAGGSPATDGEISQHAVWMGLLANAPGTHNGDSDDRGGVAPLLGEDASYVSQAPQSAMAGNLYNGVSAPAGHYCWVVGQYGQVFGAYKAADAHWYSGYRGVYP